MTHDKTFVTTTCPVARTVDLLGDRWMLMIIRDAFDGMSRFSDFQKSTGVAKNVLAARLKILLEAGIFSQAPANEGGAYKAYHLTEKGKSLLPLIVTLRQWGGRTSVPGRRIGIAPGGRVASTSRQTARHGS
ncbi:HxlR family transcriptional regulator [Lelliottia amnigena]|nr:HxlR family transcriptional regulator [Lelliottia amnigena]